MKFNGNWKTAPLQQHQHFLLRACPPRVDMLEDWQSAKMAGRPWPLSRIHGHVLVLQPCDQGTHRVTSHTVTHELPTTDYQVDQVPKYQQPSVSELPCPAAQRLRSWQRQAAAAHGIPLAQPLQNKEKVRCHGVTVTVSRAIRQAKSRPKGQPRFHCQGHTPAFPSCCSLRSEPHPWSDLIVLDVSGSHWLSTAGL